MIEQVEMKTHPTARCMVAIVTYNSRHTIEDTLTGLQESVQTGLAEIVVVDNASKDGTADYVKEQFPNVNVLRNSVNIGFGRGCNEGFRKVETPYILILNPDAVIDHTSLSLLVEFLDGNPRAGICGPAVQEASGVLQPAGNLPDPWKIMLKPILPGWATRNQRHVAPGEKPRTVDWICGSVMLLRTEMIDQIGGFDPRFFLYFEETDLCYRAREAGWQIWTVGKAVANHVNAASAKATGAKMQGGTISEHYYKSRFYYIIKHYGWVLAVTSEIGELVFMVVRIVLNMMRGKGGANIGARLKAPILQLPSKPKKNVP
jgi:hypothetical protein